MSSRFLIPLLCAGAIALACGPRAHNEASAPQKRQTVAAQSLSSTAPAIVLQGAPRTRGAVAKTPITAQIYVRAADSQIRLALHVMNDGKKRVELIFPSGQTYDFAIVDSLGREMWRWGNGRMFTQALHNRTLSSGEMMEIEETLVSAKLPPGRYIARASLKSENFPIVEQTEFTVPGTTVASR